MEIVKLQNSVCETREQKFPSAVTIGKFDGLHRGHLVLLKETVEMKREGLKPVVVCFALPDEALMTEEERFQAFERAGAELVIVLPYRKEILHMEAEAFIEELLVKRLHIRHLSVGMDFRFGKDRKGDIRFLQEAAKRFSFSLSVHEKLRLGSEEISSSMIREKLKEGRVEEANEALGYAYGFSGEVVHGKALGRTLGFPTLNIPLEEAKLLPRFGVYLSETVIEQEHYYGILNIGVRPTVDKGSAPIMEVHLFFANQDFYGKRAEVRLLSFIRAEKKFQRVQELKAQVQSDIQEARKRCP